MLDRLVVPEGAKKASHIGQIRTDLGLEAKTASAFATGRAAPSGASLVATRCPSPILCSVPCYMALTGCSRWDLAVLFGNTEFRIYHLSPTILNLRR